MKIADGFWLCSIDGETNSHSIYVKDHKWDGWVDDGADLSWWFSHVGSWSCTHPVEETLGSFIEYESLLIPLEML